ncbi:hypothetical protein NEUTE2DRAFT_49901, partial [Neurospora tetrasperma FGSC 2509]
HVSKTVANPKDTVADRCPTVSGPTHTDPRPPSCALPALPPPELQGLAMPGEARSRSIDRTSRVDNVTPTRKLPGRSPSPSGDVRIPLWRNETRAFKCTCELPPRIIGKELAESAHNAELWVDGKPQFNLFVDGSHKPYEPKTKDHRRPEYHSWGYGGYGVVFRNPYHGKGSAEFDHNHNDNAKSKSHTKEDEDELGPGHFSKRSWRSYRVLSIDHAELAAIFQGLATFLTLVRRHRPPSGTSVCVFTDSSDSVRRLRNKRALADDEPVSLRNALTMPLVRAIIWLSHCISDEGCEIKLQWLPRCCVRGHKLADRAAGSWRRKKAVFYQKNKPLWRRDGTLDAVHEDLMKVVKRIEAGEQALLPHWSERKHKPKENKNDEDMLENFSDSAVQKEIEKDSGLIDTPSNKDQDSASVMIHEDPMESWKTRKGPRPKGERPKEQRAGNSRKNCRWK